MQNVIAVSQHYKLARLVQAEAAIAPVNLNKVFRYTETCSDCNGTTLSPNPILAVNVIAMLTSGRRKASSFLLPSSNTSYLIEAGGWVLCGDLDWW